MKFLVVTALHSSKMDTAIRLIKAKYLKVFWVAMQNLIKQFVTCKTVMYTKIYSGIFLQIL